MFIQMFIIVGAAIGGIFGIIQAIKQGREDRRREKEMIAMIQREQGRIKYYQYKAEKLEKQEK